MLEDKDIERLKEIFVTRRECHDSIDTLDNKLGNDLVRITVIETRLNQITWLLTAVAGGVITMLIKMFFPGV